MLSTPDAAQCKKQCVRNPHCHAAEFSLLGRGCTLYNPTCIPEVRYRRRFAHDHALFISEQRRPPPITVQDLRSMMTPLPSSRSPEARAARVAGPLLSGASAVEVAREAAAANVTLPEGCGAALRKQPAQPSGLAPMGSNWIPEPAPSGSYRSTPVSVTEEDLRVMGVHAYVSPRHRFIFFAIAKVACSEWIRMFDRLWGHADFDAYAAHVPAAPHFRFEERTRGRLLMRDLGTARATAIMNDPTWFKAVLFRDPAERLLSAYLDKFVEHHSYYSKVFRQQSRMTFAELVDRVSKPQAEPPDGVGAATNVHWRAQLVVHHLFTFLHKLDFVGWASAQHAKKLLQRRGLWEQYGATGWSRGGTSHESFMGGRVGGDGHQTGARRRMDKYMTPELRERIRRAYAIDYGAFDAIGLRPGGEPVSGAAWQPRSARCPGPRHGGGVPWGCQPGLGIPPQCAKWN
eukprot:TRINITY_DN3411_c2_g1_i2.p1 TRINITY_DN3411_c2_g1~~TRINITY_DN3411_c2_g1_i2.p1  ORF type:complete len:459 (+),score=128.23 TRINITY_DN3411_c2_g1_i2:300-1676(+)